MKLSDLKLPVYKYPVGDDSIEFRGLSYSDVVQIFTEDPEQLERLIDKGKTLFNKGENVDMTSIVTELVSESPDLIASIIAYSANDPDAKGVVNDMTLSAQTIILKEIATLTFSESGSVGKYLQLVVGMLTSATTELTKATENL